MMFLFNFLLSTKISQLLWKGCTEKSCRELKDHPHITFPILFKIQFKSVDLKISTTTLVQHCNLTLLVLTRVLEGEMHCWFYP